MWVEDRGLVGDNIELVCMVEAKWAIATYYTYI
jgi:hypothetical protein